jgi:16S rRNA (cytidine1402-2'-O)-methyltransferase
MKKEEEKFKNALNLAKENYAEKPQVFDKELPDPINEKYFTYVKDSEDFRERLNIIQNSEEKIAEYIDPIAENYEKELHISYKLKQKAKFIMGLTKKKEEFNKEKDNTSKQKETKTSSSNNSNESEEATEREKIKSRFENNSHLEEELEEYLSLELGLSDNMFFSLQKKIKQEKESKGRGLLISFNQENEEKRIPKLIKAMKLGLRVTLVSNAGTPTISDPGFKLVKETSKNGILIEPLPGPVAAITALSASSMPTDKFLFIGFLSKSSSEKITKLMEVKNIGFTSIFYENPTRLIKTVEAMKEVYGEKHSIYIGIELTKKFETHFYGRLSEIIPKLEEKYNKDNVGIRGEVTIILAPVEKVVENDKNFINETISIDLLEFAKIANTSLKLPSNSFADFLVKTCKISNKKASNIINHIRYPENKLLKEIKSFKGVQIPKIGVKEEEFIGNMKEKKTSKLFKNLKVVKEPMEKFKKDENFDL